MAVYAAHLTRTLQGTPSIFEVTAQEALGATVKPALRKVFEFLASVNPKKFEWTVKWYDELYLLLNGVLQYHYLEHYAASFSENFYGLQRVCLGKQEFTDGLHISARSERLSWLLLVLFPYVRNKLEDMTEKYRLDEADGLVGKSWRDLCRRVLSRVYMWLHLALETAGLVQFLRYVSGRARAHSLVLAAAGVALQYAPPAMPEGDTWTELGKNLARGRLRSATLTFPMVGYAILRGMELGAFFVQFLKWWESGAPAAGAALPVPDPPQVDKNAERYKNKCPICLLEWKIPTVLPSSGYVFCYKCILRQLKETGKCPVTGYPGGTGDLIRMYVDS